MPYVQDILKRADEARTRIKEISPEDARAWIELGAAIVDVREEKEFAAGKIPGAILVSLGPLETAIEAAVPDKSTPVLVYCAIGHRSAIGADVLQQLGYTSVASLGGGLKAYLESSEARKIA